MYFVLGYLLLALFWLQLKFPSELILVRWYIWNQKHLQLLYHPMLPARTFVWLLPQTFHSLPKRTTHRSGNKKSRCQLCFLIQFFKFCFYHFVASIKIISVPQNGIGQSIPWFNSFGRITRINLYRSENDIPVASYWDYVRKSWQISSLVLLVLSLESR